jgi:hypothetical protein
MDEGSRVWLSQLIGDLAKALWSRGAFRFWDCNHREFECVSMNTMIRAGSLFIWLRDLILTGVNRNSKV